MMFKFSVWARLKSRRNAWVCLWGSSVNLSDALKAARWHRAATDNVIRIRANL